MTPPAAASPAGYSHRPLPQKLGLKAGRRLLLVAAPTGFASTLDPWPEGLVLSELAEGATLAGGADGESATFDHILAFYTSHGPLAAELPLLKASLAFDGGLWIAWPKRASGWPTDLTEDGVRALALAGGLVDNKVCAIDAVWSGLRLVYRLVDRPVRAR